MQLANFMQNISLVTNSSATQKNSHILLFLFCWFSGSSKQLETTEHSNGIVQDDPEIIAQQTEKVDVLLHRIKSSTSSAARIYGEVLCQIVRDLVPPNEILTKVIKEFLAINQPHCEVIARIVYQVCSYFLALSCFYFHLRLINLFIIGNYIFLDIFRVDYIA